MIEESAEVARVHGLVEGTGWAAYGRTEANLSLGDWDAAIAAGLEAIAYAEARDLRRIVVRTWFALRPIAVARGQVDLLQQGYPPFAARQGLEPDSFYARIVVTAMHLAFAERRSRAVVRAGGRDASPMLRLRPRRSELARRRRSDRRRVARGG